MTNSVDRHGEKVIVQVQTFGGLAKVPVEIGRAPSNSTTISVLKAIEPPHGPFSSAGCPIDPLARIDDNGVRRQIRIQDRVPPTILGAGKSDHPRVSGPGSTGSSSSEMLRATTAAACSMRIRRSRPVEPSAVEKYTSLALPPPRQDEACGTLISHTTYCQFDSHEKFEHRGCSSIYGVGPYRPHRTGREEPTRWCLVRVSALRRRSEDLASGSCYRRQT